MKKLKSIKVRQILPALLIIFIFFNAYSQKLPSTQQISLWAPANIKIDGKATSWNNQFQAYNKATGIFYTMANDDKFLYLIVQAADVDIINRIVGRGLTLHIQKPGKKDAKNGINITYPVIDSKAFLSFSFRVRSGTTLDTSTKAADSIMIHNNNRLAQNCKWIRINGVEGLDTLISVYNEYSIKAVGLFDRKKVYTYELAVPLKYLGLSANNTSKFVYNIQLNGLKTSNFDTSKMIVYGGDPAQHAAMAEGLAQRLNLVTAQLSAPTDFWGEYTLARK